MKHMKKKYICDRFRENFKIADIYNSDMSEHLSYENIVDFILELGMGVVKDDILKIISDTGFRNHQKEKAILWADINEYFYHKGIL